ncbi:MAG: (Na+)-NQR maturation NqrM [Candidatus Latescibacteria bacterium]|nr:ApbE family protein [Gemmatimonadaceae bacterium]MDP6017508.1 (Na+)-NQR maturation NqrM [Candidatus Latescibacterota bacterium]MDP7447352.1 (Na+)-NQR maturation NqrM [Candidatus Latescibacterota bacterium]HJP32058.1 (Na+)-NQR maturation NqrM [Candidatus Latescibacterota bacterium]
MSLFVAAFVGFCVVMTGMAVGVIVSNRRITGSCGGLANMKTEDGEPMCECGARAGESCGNDPERRFDQNRATVDEEAPATAV